MKPRTRRQQFRDLAVDLRFIGAVILAGLSCRLIGDHCSLETLEAYRDLNKAFKKENDQRYGKFATEPKTYPPENMSAQWPLIDGSVIRNETWSDLDFAKPKRCDKCNRTVPCDDCINRTKEKCVDGQCVDHRNMNGGCNDCGQPCL